MITKSLPGDGIRRVSVPMSTSVVGRASRPQAETALTELPPGGPSPCHVTKGQKSRYDRAGCSAANRSSVRIRSREK